MPRCRSTPVRVDRRAKVGSRRNELRQQRHRCHQPSRAGTVQEHGRRGHHPHTLSRRRASLARSSLRPPARHVRRATEIGALVREGVLRPLAVTSLEPMPQLPGVPPVAATLPGLDVTSWQGIFAPAATPPEVLAVLEAALLRVTRGDALPAACGSRACRWRPAARRNCAFCWRRKPGNGVRSSAPPPSVSNNPNQEFPCLGLM
jgi:hypothetical protein